MAHLAQSQANYCARMGHMVHSNRYAFQGGENLAQGGRYFPPKAIVTCWMHSKAGHREYLLSPRVTKAGVGTARRNDKTFAAWAFSDDSPSYPDCPHFKNKATQIKLPNPFKILLGRYNMPTNPFKIGLSLVLGGIGLIGMVLGLHGVYVYFNRVDFIFGGEINKLFLVVDVPIRLQSMVMWASVRGVQSWVVPTLIFIGGLWILSFSRISSIISRLLSKIRP